MKLFRKYINRLKKGYEIADGLYLSSPSNDELVITDDEDRKLKIYFERLLGGPDRILHKPDEIKFFPPHENEIVSEQRCQYIMSSLRKHFEKLGEDVEFK
jgi:hypothetical protein